MQGNYEVLIIVSSMVLLVLLLFLASKFLVGAFVDNLLVHRHQQVIHRDAEGSQAPPGSAVATATSVPATTTTTT